MNVHTLQRFLSEYLEVDRFQDYCPNGLQVEGNPRVTRIALGVSASLELFKKAKSKRADTVIVHHGLFWSKTPAPLTGVHGARIAYLFQNRMNLFGYHLPLDHHAATGNNACIADALGLEKRERFAVHGGVMIGTLGKLPRPQSLAGVRKSLEHFFGRLNHVYPFGRKTIRTVAMVSGGAASDAEEAHHLGADLYVTGESSEPTQEWCREAGMNFIAAGHYASEQFGVQALGKVITEKFKIPCHFIPIPNIF